MASGDSLLYFPITSAELPSINYASGLARNTQPYLAFDQTVHEAAYFPAVMPNHYAAGGIAVTIMWHSGFTTGDVIWTAAVERQDDGGQDIDIDSFATGVDSSPATTPATSGVLKYTTINLSNSQIDGLLKNERFRLSISRRASDANDTLAGDAGLVGVYVREQ